MRRVAVLATLILLIIPLTLAAPAVTRTMPQEAHAGNLIEIIYAVSSATPKETFSLEDTLPAGFEVINWTVKGSLEAREDVLTRTKEHSFAWSFNASSTKPTITAIVDVGASVGIGNYTLSAVWFDPSGFSKEESRIEIVEEPPAPATPPRKLVKATTKKKASSPVAATGTVTTWTIPAIDAYTAWGITFFVLSFALVVGLYYSKSA
ncbi:hypothetical protein HY641_02125 [Candidatus Woesearchaeota archaeon]|nr:hypothetical protein [Candidatus Woesearchaeota archaeon]